MILYFLNSYVRFKEIPIQVLDVNMANDYTNLKKIFDLCKEKKIGNSIGNMILGESRMTDIRQMINPELEFTETDLMSMLYYLGYLTIVGEELGYPKLGIPNNAMKEVYAKNFLTSLI